MRIIPLLSIALGVFIVFISMNSFAGDIKQLMSQRIVSIKTFDIGGINFTMTASDIIAKLKSQGYEHQDGGINKHLFKKGVMRSENFFQFIIQFRHREMDSLPRNIAFSYVPKLGNNVPDWEKEHYREQAKIYMNVLCGDLSRDQQDEVQAFCGLKGNLQKETVRIPPMMGIDGQQYIFNMERGGYRHDVHAQVAEVPHQ